MEISFFGFSASRNSSCATISEAESSSTGPVRKMMRSRSRREKMSKARSPRVGLLDHHRHEIVGVIVDEIAHGTFF